MDALPDGLIQSLRQGNVVLLLGAGASYGAKTPSGSPAPLGAGLAKIIAQQFLGPQFEHYDLQAVSKYAEALVGVEQVEELINEVFRPLEPTPAHLKLPLYRWRAIATTNYDLLVERAYAANTDEHQILQPWVRNKDQISRYLQDPRSLLYLKLHGCLDYLKNPEVPLILTPEQFLRYRENRRNLYSHLLTLAFECPVVFIGSSLVDSDLLNFIQSLEDELGAERPQHYVVDPGILDLARPYYEQKRVYPLKMTFDDFMTALDSVVPEKFRVLMGLLPPGHPIENRLVVDKSRVPSLDRLVQTECHYVYPDMPLPPEEASDFYKGKMAGFFPIAQGFDVERGISRKILTQLREASARHTEGILLLGPAGSGKTVLLHRIAWEAAREGRLCLFVREGRIPPVAALEEFWNAIDERLFIFVDNLPDVSFEVEDLIKRARAQRKPVSIITAARHNEWNTLKEDFDKYFDQEHEVRDLSDAEVRALLGKLEQYRCLGILEVEVPEIRFERLKVGAQRQLLVGLYEATQGRSFEDIIVDEYRRLTPPEAQRLYLGVCLLHRFGLFARATLLQKRYGIPHQHFRDRLYLPLEKVIFEQDSRSTGPAYRTRHPEIARILFERIWDNPLDRLGEVARFIPHLNPSYEEDEQALRVLTDHRKLLEQYGGEIDGVRQVYEAAIQRDESNYTYRQWGLFEMRHRDPDYTRAEELFAKGLSLSPRDPYTRHALAELTLQKARSHLGEPEAFRDLVADGHEILTPLLSRPQHRSVALHSLTKFGLLEVDHAKRLKQDEEMADRLDGVQKLISQGLKEYPQESRFSQVQADLLQRLQDDAGAVSALRRAFDKAPERINIALQLVRLYQKGGQRDDAQEVLTSALRQNPDNRDLNYSAYQFYRPFAPSHDLLQFLLKSFQEGDQNFEAQFWYARYAFEFGSAGEKIRAERIFSRLLNNRDLGKIRHTVKEWPTSDAPRHTGILVTKRTEFGFVRANRDGTEINVTPQSAGRDEWPQLPEGARVTYQIGYRYGGPIACHLEQIG